jgi:hypothetical protein
MPSQDISDSTTAYFTNLNISDRPGVTSCSTQECDVPAFKCLVGTAQCECTNWKYFAPACKRKSNKDWVFVKEQLESLCACDCSL